MHPYRRWLCPIVTLVLIFDQNFLRNSSFSLCLTILMVSVHNTFVEYFSHFVCLTAMQLSVVAVTEWRILSIGLISNNKLCNFSIFYFVTLKRHWQLNFFTCDWNQFCRQRLEWNISSFTWFNSLNFTYSNAIVFHGYSCVLF